MVFRLLIGIISGVLIFLLIISSYMFWMPGPAMKGSIPELSVKEREFAEKLEADVRYLSVEIGERNIFTEGSMEMTADWLEKRFREMGFAPRRQTYALSESFEDPKFQGTETDNLIVEIPGTEMPEKVIVIGAHYDSVEGSPGANDNGTGVAALLALAEWFSSRPQPLTIRFVAFSNEEPPFFQTSEMGSYAYAKKCYERGDQIKAMISFDGLGYFDETSGSQHYPAPGIGFVKPDKGNFIGFVARLRDAGLLRKAIGAFREGASIPSDGAALPGFIPGVSWSDHWSFWQFGFKAIMITDTLPFRDPHYHTPNDLPDHLNYEYLARVTVGMKQVIEKLAR